MRLIVLGIAVAAVIPSLTSGAAARHRSFCSVVFNPFVRQDSAQTRLLGETAAATRFTRVFIFDLSAQGRREDSVISQVVHWRLVGGRDSAFLAARRSAGDDRISIVRWGMGSMCERTAYHTALPVSTHAIVGRLRPDSLWIDEIPTFDVTATMFRPYPSDHLSDPDLRLPERMLEAADVYDLLAAIPEWSSRQPTGCMVAPALKEWLSRHRDRLDVYPITRLQGYVIPC
jgi:hypothetical protein